MIEVTAADGSIVEFPDGTSPADIQAKMKEFIAARQTSPAPAPQAESAPRPSNWERLSRHAQHSFTDTNMGGMSNIASQASGDNLQVQSLTNQKKAIEATPSIFGGPNQSRLQTINEQLEKLRQARPNSDRQLVIEQYKKDRAERKKAFENMPPAEGFVENAAAVAGHVLGSLPTPETLIPPLRLAKAAPVAVRAGATFAEKVAARATPEALKNALKVGAYTGATNAAVDPIIQSMNEEEYDPDKTFMKGVAGFGIGTVLRGAKGLLTDPTHVPQLKYPSDADVLANRADRAAAEEAGKLANANKRTVAERILTQIQDAGRPLHRLMKDGGDLKTILDAPIDALARPTARLTLVDEYQLLKTAANQADYAVMNGTFHFAPDGQSIVPTGKVGLHGILSPLKEDANRFLEYIAALRADFMERNRGMTSGFDPRRTAAILHDYTDNPAFQVARDNYREFTDWLLAFKKDAGIYSAEDVSRIKQWNPDYISYYRVDEEDGLPIALASVGKDRRLRGSPTIVADLAGNLAQTVQRSITAANKNRFKQQLYDYIEGLRLTDPDLADSWAVKDKVITQALNVPEARLRAEILKMPQIKGNPAMEAVVNHLPIDDLKLFYKQRIGGGRSGDTDIVYRDGVATVYKIVDPGLMRSLQAMTPKQLAISKWTLENYVITPKKARELAQIFDVRPEAIGPLYNWLNENLTLGSAKTGFTKIITMNPPFAMLANPLRDSQNALVTSKLPVSEVVPLFAQIKSAYEMMMKNPEYDLFLLNGGGFAGIHSTETKSGLNNLYIKSGVDPFKDVLNTPESLWGRYKEIIQGFENFVRFQEYQGLREKGVAPRAAALAGRNVSVDFAKEGASELVRNLNGSMPFLNTMIQSTTREIESLSVPNAKEIAAGADPKKWKRLLAGAGGLTATAVSAWIYNQMFHKEDYDTNLADFIKDTHIVYGYKPEWFGMPGDGHSKFITIPIPYGIGFTFAGIPVRLMESVQQGTAQPVARAVGNYLKSVANLSENPALATLEAGAQVAGISDPKEAKTFTGAPVLPKGLQGQAPITQIKPDTATWAVDTGQALGLSPVMTEYFVRQYLSGLTDVAATMYDTLTDRRTELGLGTKPDPGLQGRPFIGRLIKDIPTKYSIYDEKLHAATKAIKQEMDTIALQKTRFNFDKLYKELAKTNPKYGALEGANKSITYVNDKINELEAIADSIHRAPDDMFIEDIKAANPGMSTEDAKKRVPMEKRKQLNQKYYERNAFVYEAVKQMEQDPMLNKAMNPRGLQPLLKSFVTGRPY